ncbi:MAG: DUF4954 domain-containing protein, partial [Ferruginibacter sp.]
AKIKRSDWLNIGGQLMKTSSVNGFKSAVKNGKINSWDEVHQFYKIEGAAYDDDKLQHAYTSLLETLNITGKQFTAELFKTLLLQAVETKSWMCKGIYNAREKDYTNSYRKMVYNNVEEMNKVMGKLEDNSFIQAQLEELDKMKKEIKGLIKKMNL